MLALDKEIKWTEYQPNDRDGEILADAWKRYSGLDWWVDERVLGLAGACPAPGLHDFALRCFDAYQEKPGSRHRKAFYAATALMRSTGKDLRFDADGKARPIRDVMADYRGLLSKE